MRFHDRIRWIKGLMGDATLKVTDKPALAKGSTADKMQHHDLGRQAELEIAVERRPPEDLPNQHMFEQHAGRPLRPIERVRVESFEKMSSEQIALARTLARASLAAGFLYLSRIVPGESTERRHELAKHLAESPPEP